MADLLDPIRVGTIALDHRLVMPPHSGGRGAMLGRPDQFERFCAYWLARVEAGVQWVGGAPTFVANPLIPGFEPTGVGAMAHGTFRQEGYVERLAEYSRRIHEAGGWSCVQMVLQGGLPSAPSQRLSGYRDHAMPHALDLDEVAWLVAEYAASAALAADGGADVVELHANHDDVLQWFLSPYTNHRDDGYGGSPENRRRFLREVVEGIRTAVDRPITLGLRLCIDEMVEGGYGLEECQRVLAAFTDEGTVDYFSLDVGNNWGAPSYVAPNTYGPAEWAALCGEAREATDLPVLYAGRVGDLDTARAVVADGHADLVGMVRALIAEPALLELSRRGEEDRARPCIGVQDCLSRRVVEHLPFACAVNPQVGREWEGPLPTVEAPRDVLVIGGGPAGTELAALAAGRGHRVRLWEAADALGGQLAVASKARMNQPYGRWIGWQADRLDRLGVEVSLDRLATADDVVAAGADVVVVATGAVARRPDADGLDQPHVLTAVEVLQGSAVGQRVLVVSEDDRPGPLAVADHLAGLGHDVTLAHRSPEPAPLVNKYTIGGVLARLDAEGGRLLPHARLVAVDGASVTMANTYSGRRFTLDDVDTVVLACGSVSRTDLHAALRERVPALHLLGDAFAPRRVVAATRQAWALAAQLS